MKTNQVAVVTIAYQRVPSQTHTAASSAAISEFARLSSATEPLELTYFNSRLLEA
jgi:hypothetical protein